MLGSKVGKLGSGVSTFQVPRVPDEGRLLTRTYHSRITRTVNPEETATEGELLRGSPTDVEPVPLSLQTLTRLNWKERRVRGKCL